MVRNKDDRNKSHGVNSVKTPPTFELKTAPRAWPAENVANAKVRAREGGNAWARIPSWIIIKIWANKCMTMIMRTYAGRNHCSGAYSLNSPQRCESYDICGYKRKKIRTFLKTKIYHNFCSRTFWECRGKGEYRQDSSSKYKRLFPPVCIPHSPGDEQETTLGN